MKNVQFLKRCLCGQQMTFLSSDSRTMYLFPPQLAWWWWWWWNSFWSFAFMPMRKYYIIGRCLRDERPNASFKAEVTLRGAQRL